MTARMVMFRAGLVLAVLQVGCGSSSGGALFGEGNGEEAVSATGGTRAALDSGLVPSGGAGGGAGGEAPGGDGGRPGAGGAPASSGGRGAAEGQGGRLDQGGSSSGSGGREGGAGGAPTETGDAASGAPGMPDGGETEAGDGCIATRMFVDSDGDGFGDPERQVLACSLREGLVLNSDDCYDGNAAARPGQTAPSGEDRGDGSFDFDCDGTGRREFTALATCGTFPFCQGTAGWRGAAPACGKEGTWVAACIGLTTLCGQPTEPRIQRCL